jgi:hypothetical protein
VSAILILVTIGNHKLRGWGGFQWCNVHINFRENQSIGSNIEMDLFKYANTTLRSYEVFVHRIFETQPVCTCLIATHLAGFLSVIQPATISLLHYVRVDLGVYFSLLPNGN